MAPIVSAVDHNQSAHSVAFRRDGLNTTRVGSMELLDALLNVRAEVLDEALYGPSSGITKGANGVAFNLLRQLEKHINLGLLSVTDNESAHHLVEPSGALTARRALSAGLVLVEVRETSNSLDNVSALVHDNDGSSTETRLDLTEGIKVHEHSVADVLGEGVDRGATWNNGEEVVPAATNTTTVTLDQFFEGDGHLFLHGARVVDVAGDAEELGAGIVLAAKGGEPRSTTAKNGGGHSDGLDVGDGGGAAVETNVGRERRLQTGLAGLAFQGLDQAGLLTANVSAATAADIDIKVVAGTARVLANEALLIGLSDGAIKAVGLVPELSTNVDVSSLGTHGETSNETAFDKLVGIVAHNLTIFARAGLGLISVHDEVVWATIRDLGHERPFEAGRETGTTATTKAGGLDFVHDPVAAHVQKVLCAVPVTLEKSESERLKRNGVRVNKWVK